MWWRSQKAASFFSQRGLVCATNQFKSAMPGSLTGRLFTVNVQRAPDARWWARTLLSLPFMATILIVWLALSTLLCLCLLRAASRPLPPATGAASVPAPPPIQSRACRPYAETLQRRPLEPAGPAILCK